MYDILTGKHHRVSAYISLGTAKCSGIVRGDSGIGRSDLNKREGNSKVFRRYLGKHGFTALSDIRGTGQKVNAAVIVCQYDGRTHSFFGGRA